MAEYKTFEPKAEAENLTVEALIPRRQTGWEGKKEDGIPKYDRKEGQTFSVTSSAWPYTAKSQAEQDLLEDHPLVKVKAKSGGGS